MSLKNVLCDKNPPLRTILHQMLHLKQPNPTIGLLGLRWNTITGTLSLSPRMLSPVNTFFMKTDTNIFTDIWSLGLCNTCVCQGQNCTSRDMANQAYMEWTTLQRVHRQLAQYSLMKQPFLELTSLHQSHASTCYIYAFSDASTKVYDTVVFICQNQEVSLVISKCRVAPIKTVTLPRLELMAAVIATRIVLFVKLAIHPQSDVPSTHIHMWINRSPLTI